MRNWNKVFEIGSPKTDTTSLGRAYEILGLRHKGWDEALFYQCKKGDFRETFRVAAKYEAFQDGPWHGFDLYLKFDKLFPNSKFILLERNLDDWILSHENHFSADKLAIGPRPIRKYAESRDRILERHIQKNNNVKEYFKSRPDDLLVMNICDGEGWEVLCPFLGVPIPEQKFPILNVTKELGSRKKFPFFRQLASVKKLLSRY